MSDYTEWHRRGPVPDDMEQVVEIVSACLQASMDELREQIVGPNRKMAMTLIVKFERHEGDEDPFTAIATMPDNFQVSRGLILGAAGAVLEAEKNGAE